MEFYSSQNYFDKAKELIPGCAQTFSKGHTQFVQGVSPVFLNKGAGAKVWDVDGNEFVDYVQGLLPNILGYAHEGVNQAVINQLAKGHSFSLPHPSEIKLAELICDVVPCADMVRYGKNGSDVTSGAVRLARAFTGRDHIACCGYHGWQDWFIGTTTRSLGVPKVVKELTHTFDYNNPESLQKIFSNNVGKVAAVILEPVNFSMPEGDFLETVKKMTHDNGAILIFDEICTGFRLGLGGAQQKFNVTPDLACFGKAMGNGYPIACLAGRKEIMKVCEDIFFSFTYGGEVSSIVAAIKVIEILKDTNALELMECNGKKLMDGVNQLARKYNIDSFVNCIGFPVWSLLSFKGDDKISTGLIRTLFQQEMIKEGILILLTHNITATHNEEIIDYTLNAYHNVFKKMEIFLHANDPLMYLDGPVIQPVFKAR